MPPMVPVYFQTSRWLRGYLQPPAYVDGYNAQRASQYTNQILGALPNAPAQPIAKLGVPDNPLGLNFGYIQGGWIQGQTNLLLAACGDPGPNADQAGKNNGRTSYATWQHAFSQLFANDPDFQRAAGYPLFAIIDTNSTHHLSAPLVERAVAYADPARLGGNPSRAMLVINFDAHTDYGAKARDVSTPITCQSWGRFVSNSVQNVYGRELADAYVRLGANPAKETPTWARGEWHQANSDNLTPRIDPSGTGSLTGQLDTVINAITHNGARDLNAYVSLDRDLLQANYTQYFDGPFPSDDGLRGVTDCLEHLVSKGARIIGFDVCGLPTFPGGTRIKEKEMSIPAALTLAEGQITTLWQFLVG